MYPASQTHTSRVCNQQFVVIRLNLFSIIYKKFEMRNAYYDDQPYIGLKHISASTSFTNTYVYVRCYVMYIT